MNFRIYAHGPPNNDKTGALVRTAVRPLYIINSPGETGYATIPTDDPGITVAPLFDPTKNSSKLIQAVEKVCGEAIKSGQYQTIAFEGINNLGGYVLDSISGGDYFGLAKVDWGLYPLVYRWLDLFIAKLMMNNTPNVVLTGWSKEKGEHRAHKGEKPEDVPQIIGPDMMGEYSRMIIGRVPMVFHQTLKVVPNQLDKEGKKIYASAWQTHPYGTIKGCGIKGPARIVEKIPLLIPADYTYLKQLWEELDGNQAGK